MWDVGDILLSHEMFRILFIFNFSKLRSELLESWRMSDQFNYAQVYWQFVWKYDYNFTSYSYKNIILLFTPSRIHITYLYAKRKAPILLCMQKRQEIGKKKISAYQKVAYHQL